MGWVWGRTIFFALYGGIGTDYLFRFCEEDEKSLNIVRPPIKHPIGVHYFPSYQIFSPPHLKKTYIFISISDAVTLLTKAAFNSPLLF